MKFIYILFAITLLVFLIPFDCMSGVIFEDDFNGFTSGWTPIEKCCAHRVYGSPSGRGEPTGWTGYIWEESSTESDLRIVTGEGRGGTPAFRVQPNVLTGVSGQMGLTKWLGPTGYNEIYIRYFLKYSDSRLWGNGQGGSYSYQKLNRVWQNITSTNLQNIPTGVMSNEHGKGWMLFGIADDDYSTFDPFARITLATNSTDDSLGQGISRFTYQWNSANTVSFVENHFGAINTNGSWATTQGWHCIEIHLKLASAWGQDDGIYELWIDGIKQNAPTYTLPQYGYAGGLTKMPTAKIGTGINYVTFSDNLDQKSGLPKWSYWIDDVVISTSYIGPNYVIGGGSAPDTMPPAAPTSLR
ncbi:MAG: hypothetical protein HY757_02145 [Nitrospirae bacterium]|nr:hypothetical protein [Nitrospirota bacterium]